VLGGEPFDGTAGQAAGDEAESHAPAGSYRSPAGAALVLRIQPAAS
jgi:hypothetical protein